MNNLTRTLLAGAALAALTAVPAVAQNYVPRFHFRTLHGGLVVNKTKMPNHGAAHLTYTLGVYTQVPVSDYRKTVGLENTLRFETYYSSCVFTWKEMKAPKKAEYGKVGVGTLTVSDACSPGTKREVFYNTYKLTDPDAQGKKDRFVSTLIGKYQNNGAKYKATVNLDVDVYIR